MTTLIPAQLHPEQLLTTNQVAAITGIAKSTFEGWRSRKNGGPKVKDNMGPQIVRYRWADVKAWIDGTVIAA